VTRTFVDNPAIREQTAILLGIVGPSSSGKTYSALEVATGGVRVTGGEIFVIDTENRRALHYADKFKYRHVPFGAPFSPDDYLEAITYCAKKGGPGSWIIVDSMSHEHEGKGGVLEMHSAELDRRAGNDWDKREKLNMLCWSKPKAARRRMINGILQLDANFIFCFRAKPKVDMKPGQAPVALGYQAIAGDDFIFEMTLKFLLLAGANGVPTWESKLPGEQRLIKLTEDFKPIFASRPQLSKDIGEAIAKWGKGSPKAADKPPATAAEIIKGLEACSEGATFRSLQTDSRAAWSTFSEADKKKIKVAGTAAEERIKKAGEAPPDPSPNGEPTDEEKREIERLEVEEAKKAAANG
jgi:hypothetical protein